MFESSWALFRHRDDSQNPGRYHEKALGNLKTLSSPFFQEEYLPQAAILKAVILYSRCEYDKALSSVEEFRRVYEPLLNEIRGYVKDYPDPIDLYNRLRENIMKKFEDLLCLFCGSCHLSLCENMRQCYT